MHEPYSHITGLTFSIIFSCTCTGQGSHISLVAMEAVETQCLKAFSTLVVKLSETLFRPMFIKLLDWATQSSAPRDRLITFYHVADWWVIYSEAVISN